jgi:chemotaxis protein MotB
VADQTVVIVKKIKRAHGGHHGGAWKVAFADFVSAMMALFIVLWILGQSKDVKQAVSGYFRDPGVFQTSPSGGVSPDGGRIIVAPESEEASTPPPDLAEFLRQQQHQAQERTLRGIGDSLRAVIAARPEFSRLKDQIEIAITDEGLRIELLEKEGSSFFEVGDAQLKSSAVSVLRAIASEVRALPNPIVLEGHTDSRPYASNSARSNWDLSTERANSARRVIEQFGVRAEQIVQIRGYADKQLRYPENPYEVRNRRVSIVILYGA